MWWPWSLCLRDRSDPRDKADLPLPPPSHRTLVQQGILGAQACLRQGNGNPPDIVGMHCGLASADTCLEGRA